MQTLSELWSRVRSSALVSPGSPRRGRLVLFPRGSRQAGILCPATSGDSSTWGSISTGLWYVLSGAMHTEEMGARRAQLLS